jgi:hypothetical protein
LAIDWPRLIVVIVGGILLFSVLAAVLERVVFYAVILILAPALIGLDVWLRRRDCAK